MARITAGVGSSHVPLLGVAVDQGKSRDDYFGPIFAGYDWTRAWEAAEKPEGEWNTYAITFDGPSIVVLVNGKKVNEAGGATVMPGRIALQSEGGEVHFRRVEIRPIVAR